MFSSTISFAARPFLTDDPGINETGKFEFMAACDFWNDRATPGIQLRHGITERMDLGINLGYCILPNDEKHFSCADINMKFSIIPDLFTAGFSGSFEKAAYYTYGIFGKAFGPITVNANLGYSAAAETNEGDFDYFLSVYYENEYFGIGPELGGTQEGLNLWAFGGRWHFTDWFTYDIGIQGDYKDPICFNVTTGIDIVFPHVKK
jgi:hypothetical protein